MTAMLGAPLPIAPPRATPAGQARALLKAELPGSLWAPVDRFNEAGVGERLGVSPRPRREACFGPRDDGTVGADREHGFRVKPIDGDRIDQAFNQHVAQQRDLTCRGDIEATYQEYAEIPSKVTHLRTAQARGDRVAGFRLTPEPYLRPRP